MKCANKHLSVLCQGLFSLLVFLTGMFALSTNHLAAALSNESVIGSVNNERRAAGLPALNQNSKLSSSAYHKAQDMCTKHYWAHDAPDGTTPWAFVDAAGYAYVTVGENLAQGFTSDDAVVAGWMASPGHRANILNTTYQDIGVASLTCNLVGTETTLVVAHFGSVAQTASRPAPVQAQPVAATPVATAQPSVVAEQPTTQPAAPVVVTPKAPSSPQPSFIDQLISQLTLSHELALFKHITS